MESALLNHLSNRQCSRQWKQVLGAFAHELVHDLTPRHLRKVMRRSGERFAGEHTLAGTTTVADLQAAINRIWSALDWGWVEIAEADDHLALTHYCAPLRAGFGPDQLTWTTGFLEGAYECWMRHLGADPQLRVTQKHEPDGWGTIEYRFGP